MEDVEVAGGNGTWVNYIVHTTFLYAQIVFVQSDGGKNQNKSSLWNILVHKAMIVICNEGAQNGLTSTIDVDY